MARIHMGTLDRALIVEEPHSSLDTLLGDMGVSVHRHAGGAPSEDELVALLSEHRSQVIFKRSRVPVTRRIIEAAPDLLAVQLCCIGDDSVDKQAAADHGVMVFNDPVSNGRSVVEMAIGHLISLSRRFYETDRSCRDGAWEKNNLERYEIRGKVLGVLGLGNIGRAVARAAEGLGMRICFQDNREVAQEVGQEFGWTECDSIQELFECSDYVSVHVSARDIHGETNAALIDGPTLRSLGAQRPDNSPRIFLNLSRGFLHSPEDLVGAIRDGNIRRAAVDVYPDEPRGLETWVNPYVDESRIVVTPHIGASTQEAQPRIALRATQTFRNFSRRGRVRDCVFGHRVRLQLLEGTPGSRAVLMVGHATSRGTKRAIDDAIYEAGASNLASAHRDFAHLGFAFDLAALDKPLGADDVARLVAAAAEITGDPYAIRSVRQVVLDA